MDERAVEADDERASMSVNARSWMSGNERAFHKTSRVEENAKSDHGRRTGLICCLTLGFIQNPDDDSCKNCGMIADRQEPMDKVGGFAYKGHSVEYYRLRAFGTARVTATVEPTVKVHLGLASVARVQELRTNILRCD